MVSGRQVLQQCAGVAVEEGDLSSGRFGVFEDGNDFETFAFAIAGAFFDLALDGLFVFQCCPAFFFAFFGGAWAVADVERCLRHDSPLCSPGGV